MGFAPRHFARPVRRSRRFRAPFASSRPGERNLTIELGRGATYSDERFTVYEHGVYPCHSVLAGQPSRTYVDSFKTLSEAIKAYPTATVIEGTTYAPPSLSHLSDDGDY